jgi:hypothetical protein
MHASGSLASGAVNRTTSLVSRCVGHDMFHAAHARSSAPLATVDGILDPPRPGRTRFWDITLTLADGRTHRVAVHERRGSILMSAERTMRSEPEAEDRPSFLR